jgi:hypothetical protein
MVRRLLIEGGLSVSGPIVTVRSTMRGIALLLKRLRAVRNRWVPGELQCR